MAPAGALDRIDGLAYKIATFTINKPIGVGMDNTVEIQIIEVEERLRAAMLASDGRALDELLAPELIFTNHLGGVIGKEDDLAAHRSGAVEVHELTFCERQIRIYDDVAIVSVRVRLSGRFVGVPSQGDFRFTRVWALSGDRSWRVVAGHSGLVA